MEDGGGGVTPKFDSRSTKDHFTSNLSAEDLKVIFVSSHNMANMYKWSGKKITTKTGRYVTAVKFWAHFVIYNKAAIDN